MKCFMWNSGTLLIQLHSTQSVMSTLKIRCSSCTLIGRKKHL